MARQETLLIIFLCAYMQFSYTFTKDGDICYWHHPHINDYPECYFNVSRQRLVCFNGLKDECRTRAESVQILILCEWPKRKFDPQTVLREFTVLRKLMIANSNLTEFTTGFSINMTFLEKINVTGTKLRILPKDAFVNLTALKSLDLRNNAFQEINITAFHIPVLKHVYLNDNPLRCTEDTTWILDRNEGSLASKIVDRDKLLCATPYDGRPLVPIVEIIATLKEECKRTVCNCELIYVTKRIKEVMQKQLRAFTSVNCSYRGLTEMPSFLPANTTTLYLTGNKISDLTPLTTNPVYETVVDLYIDNNLIESIVHLEGSNWLDRFRLLNLRGNKLTDVGSFHFHDIQKLPTYALKNALLHNTNAVRLYLGNNSWRCDCHFTPSFQGLLTRYPNLVKDINDVRCALMNDDDNSNRQIRQLTRTEICILPKEHSLYPLDILNIILASLIFLILGKLLYDYWSFKKTGKLPWIVAKMP